MTTPSTQGQRHTGTGTGMPEEEAAAATVLSSLGAVTKRAMNLRERKGSAAGKQSVPTPPASTTTGTTGTTGDASRGSGSDGYARRGQLWTDAEEAQFEKGLEELGPDYKRISQEFVPTRTIESVRNHARKIRNKLVASGSKPPTQAASTFGKRKHNDVWTEAEQEAFSRGVAKLGRGPEAWKYISEDFVRTRSPEEVEEYARGKEFLLDGSLLDRVRSAKRSRKTLYSTRMNARGDEHKRSLKYATNLFDDLQRMVKQGSQRKKRMMVTMDQLFERGNLNAQDGTDIPLSDIFAYRTHGVSDARRRKLTDASRMFLTTWLDHAKSAYEFPFERDEGANERGGTLSFHVNDMAEHCADILRERSDTPPIKAAGDDAKPLARIRGRPTPKVTKTAIRGGLLRTGRQPYCELQFAQRVLQRVLLTSKHQHPEVLELEDEDEWDDYIRYAPASKLTELFTLLRTIYYEEAAEKNRVPEETHRYGFALATTHAVGWGLSNDFGLPIPVVAIGSPSSDGSGRASLVVPLVKDKGKDPRALWCFSDPIELRSTEDKIIWSELENTFPEREAFAWATADDDENIEAWKKLCLDTFSARGIKPPDEFHENAEQIKRARDRETRHKLCHVMKKRNIEPEWAKKYLKKNWRRGDEYDDETWECDEFPEFRLNDLSSDKQQRELKKRKRSKKVGLDPRYIMEECPDCQIDCQLAVERV